jgi:hypothetical protein
MTMTYWDRYERIGGSWLFRRRLPLYWYAADLRTPPLGPRKMRWPDREWYEGGYSEFWPSWREFWEPGYSPDSDVPAPAPLDEFLLRMRPREGLSVRVR